MAETLAVNMYWLVLGHRLRVEYQFSVGQGHIFIALLPRPPVESFSWGDLRCRGATAEHGERCSVMAVNGVTQICADRELVSEMVVAGRGIALVEVFARPSPSGS